MTINDNSTKSINAAIIDLQNQIKQLQHKIGILSKNQLKEDDIEFPGKVEYADEAGKAKEADHAKTADTAKYTSETENAVHAGYADIATKATQDGSGNVITDTYATKTELTSGLSGKADKSHTHTKSQITDFDHTHDDRYYTESEVDTKLSGKADKSHTHTKSEITDFPTSLPANGGTANKIVPNYTSVALTTVTSSTIKYIKLADCAWNQTGTLQVLLSGENLEDTLIINFGGGHAGLPILCGHYIPHMNFILSVIAQKGSNWNSNYSIYIKIRQITYGSVNVAILRGSCTINITESTIAPTNISEWPVYKGLFGDITAPNITSLEQRVAALESKEVKDGVNQLEVKGYDKYK